MIWQIKTEPWRVYARNPLDTVVAQLKFQPILRISAEQGIADFQECVRKSFPGFNEGEIRSLRVGPDAQVSSNAERAFYFVRDEDSCTVQLTADNVLVECKEHRSREILLEDLEIVVRALEQVYQPIKTTRFGVRYINVVNLAQISEDLGREVTLESSIANEYLSMPASVVDLQQTIFANQISSPMDVGAMTLRYGVPPSNNDHARLFNFDIDRYLDGHIELNGIGELLTSFTGDIFSLFHTLPGDDLWAWMSEDRRVGAERIG